LARIEGKKCKDLYPKRRFQVFYEYKCENHTVCETRFYSLLLLKNYKI